MAHKFNDTSKSPPISNPTAALRHIRPNFRIVRHSSAPKNRNATNNDLSVLIAQDQNKPQTAKRPSKSVATKRFPKDFFKN